MEKSFAIVALAALAQDTRLDMFRMLIKAGPKGLSAGGIGKPLGLASATLSFHLSQLRHAGLIACRREGRSLIYTADCTAMSDLMAYLTENCCGGVSEACGVGATFQEAIIATRDVRAGRSRTGREKR